LKVENNGPSAKEKEQEEAVSHIMEDDNQTKLFGDVDKDATENIPSVGNKHDNDDDISDDDDDDDDNSDDDDDSDSEEHSREIEEAVQALQDAEQNEDEEVGVNTDQITEDVEMKEDSPEQGRDATPDQLPVHDPSPASQPNITDCISDTNSDAPAPLTPQVATPPQVVDSLTPECVPVDSTQSTPTTRTETVPLVESKAAFSVEKSNPVESENIRQPESPLDDDNSSDDDIPSDDYQGYSDSPEPLNPPQNFQEPFSEDLPNNFEQIETSAPNSIPSTEPIPSQESINVNCVATTPPVPAQAPPTPTAVPPQVPPPATAPAPLPPTHPQNQNQNCSSVPTGVFPPQNSAINNMPNTNMNSNNFTNVDIDVAQLGLESPTSISSNEMTNPNISGETIIGVGPNYYDCAQSQQNYINNLVAGGRYMDMVNSPHPMNSSGNYMPSGVPSTLSSYCPPPPVSSYASVLLQQNPSHTHRLSHNNTPCGVPVGRSFTGQSTPNQTNTSCSLVKLQQLTNGLTDIMPDNTMTPPPNLTPPPPVNMTPPPSMIRNMTTPPISNLQVQNSSGSLVPQSYKQYQRQRSSTPSVRKSPNVTVNPNMPPFTPNVTIRPGSNMITGYPNMLDSYRMRQPMINPGYINQGIINQFSPQLPMQMLNMNMNMNMNMNSAQQHFQQHMQPPKSNNAYAYGYMAPTLNGVMRR